MGKRASLSLPASPLLAILSVQVSDLVMTFDSSASGGPR